MIDNKIVNDLTKALTKHPELNLYVDILLFNLNEDNINDIIYKLKNIEEIKRQPDLYIIWLEILKKYER